jgi:hypothetical protein
MMARRIVAAIELEQRHSQPAEQEAASGRPANGPQSMGSPVVFNID